MQLSLDVVGVIFDFLQLPPQQIAKYRACSRALRELVSESVTHFDASVHLPESRLASGGVLGAVAGSFPRLKILHLRGLFLVSSDAASFSSTRFGGITDIDLYDCSNVTDALVSSLAQQCPKLEAVTLGGSVRSKGVGLTDLAIEALSRHSAYLHSIHLHSLAKITDSCIVNLTAHRGENLRSVTLSRCGKLSDASIMSLSSGARLLESVNLNECFRLTSAAVGALADNCGNSLLRVHIRGTRVTDDAIQALALKCPRLADGKLKSNFIRCVFTSPSLWKV